MTLDVFLGVFAALGAYMGFKVIATYLSYQWFGFDVFDDSPEIHVYIDTKSKSEEPEADES
jgi:hypothetical protein